MATQVQNRRGSTAEHSTFTGAVAEVTVDTDKDTVVVHDGATAGGRPLLREDGSNSALALGSAATPSLKFTGDANTGIYSPGADQLALSTNGTGRLFVASNGNVGVGVASASQALEVSGNIAFSANTGSSRTLGPALSSDTTLVLRAGSTTGEGANIELGRDEIVYVDAAQHVFRSTNGGSERMRLDSSGRLGLGTSSPRALLHVAGDHSNTANSFIASNLYFDGAWKYINNGYAAALKLANAAGYVSFETAPQNTSGADASATLSTRLVITPSGNVGIGTTSPSFALDVSGSGGQTIRAITTDTSGSSIARFRAFYTGGGGGTQSAVDLRAGDAYAYLTTEGSVPLLFGVNTQERARIDSSGRLLVGTSTAETASLGARFQIQATGSSASALIKRNDNGALPSYLYLGKSRGTTVNSTTIVQSGDSLGAIRFTGADGSTEVGSIAAQITAAVDGTPGANDMPGRLEFSTTADGASSPTERMRIQSTGETNIFAANTVFGARSGAGAGTTDRLVFGVYGATSTTLTGTISFTVWTNGNVVNTNNSYGSISDLKLKENIVDAGSQWSDLKSLQVRKYNFKEGPTHTQIGLIAQEVELVSPGLVTESPDRDAEGNDLGTTTKSVNYSVLYMKAVKALQEAMERIETLEAKVAALENA